MQLRILDRIRSLREQPDASTESFSCPKWVCCERCREGGLHTVHLSCTALLPLPQLRSHAESSSRTLTLSLHPCSLQLLVYAANA